MGHLVNPIGFRLGFLERWLWHDIWCLKHLFYPQFLYNTFKIRDFLIKECSEFWVVDNFVLYSHFVIYKHQKKMVINIFVYDSEFEKWVDDGLNEILNGLHRNWFSKKKRYKTLKASFRLILKSFYFSRNACYFIFSLFYTFLKQRIKWFPSISYFNLQIFSLFRYLKNLSIFWPLINVNYIKYYKFNILIWKFKYINLFTFKEKVEYFYYLLELKLFILNRLYINKKSYLISKLDKKYKFYRYMNLSFLSKLPKNAFLNSKFIYKKKNFEFNFYIFSIFFCYLNFFNNFFYKWIYLFFKYNLNFFFLLYFFKKISNYIFFFKYFVFVNFFLFLISNKFIKFENIIKKVNNLSFINMQVNISFKLKYFTIFFNFWKFLYKFFLLYNKKYIQLLLKGFFLFKDLIFRFLKIKIIIFKFFREFKSFFLFIHWFSGFNVVLRNTWLIKKQAKIFKSFYFYFHPLYNILSLKNIVYWKRFFFFKVIYGKVILHTFRFMGFKKLQFFLFSWWASFINMRIQDLTLLKSYVSIYAIQNTTISSIFLARYFSLRLEYGYSLWQTLAPIKRELKFLKLLNKGGVKGFKLSFKGRFTRKQRAKSLWIIRGELPLSSQTKFIDYSFNTVILSNSICSIKVWLYRDIQSKFYSYRLST